VLKYSSKPRFSTTADRTITSLHWIANNSVQSIHVTSTYVSACEWTINETTRKCGNCDALQLEAALRLFNYDVKVQVGQPIRCCIRPSITFFSTELIRHVTLWPWPLTLWPWHWTLVMYLLWHCQTLYQIWAKSNNLRLSYCDFNIWPYDLEHVHMLRAIRSGIILQTLNWVKLSLRDM